MSNTRKIFYNLCAITLLLLVVELRAHTALCAAGVIIVFCAVFASGFKDGLRGAALNETQREARHSEWHVAGHTPTHEELAAEATYLKAHLAELDSDISQGLRNSVKAVVVFLLICAAVGLVCAGLFGLICMAAACLLFVASYAAGELLGLAVGSRPASRATARSAAL